MNQVQRRQPGGGGGPGSAGMLAIVASLSGFFGACNEVFGIDKPHPLGSAGTPGTSGEGGASMAKGGASPSSGGASNGGTSSAGKGGVNETGGAASSGGASRGGSFNGGGASADGGTTNGGTTNGGTTNGGTTNGATGGSDGGNPDGGTDAGSDPGGSSNGGTTNNGGSTNGGTNNGGMAGTTAGMAGMAGTTAGTGGTTPTDPCDVVGLEGSEMAYLPAGTGTIGADDIATSPANTAAKPQHVESFPPLCIDKTEVTIAEYRVCVNAAGCQAPTGSGCNWSTSSSSRDTHPVTCMTQAKARAYCTWAGKRLPKENEWEYAARGPSGNRYPWGPTEPETTTNTHLNWNNIVGDTKPVGSYPAGATEKGVLDMAGNAWEWTDSLWCDSWNAGATCNSSPVARGGSWNSTDADFVRPAWRDPDSNGDKRFGFRCVYDPSP